MQEFDAIIRERVLPNPKARRALREASGLGLSELAGQIGVHRTALYRWERGVREPRGDNRARYAAFLAAAKEALRDG